MVNPLSELTTEMKLSGTQNLDQLPTVEILRLMNAEDQKVATAVKKTLGPIAEAVDLIHSAMEKGGRLFYFGAGTSGRLGILDAAECPPTFGTDPHLVQGVIAGGPSAMVKAVEGAEDSAELGWKDIKKYGVSAADAVVGLAARAVLPMSWEHWKRRKRSVRPPSPSPAIQNQKLTNTQMCPYGSSPARR